MADDDENEPRQEMGNEDITEAIEELTAALDANQPARAKKAGTRLIAQMAIDFHEIKVATVMNIRATEELANQLGRIADAAEAALGDEEDDQAALDA